MPAKKATAATSESSAAPASQPAKKTAPAKAPAKAKAPAQPAQEQPVRSRTAPVEPEPAAAEPVATASADDTAEADVAMNRAERRAKGRGKNPAQVIGSRGKVSGGHGPAHTQRNWANRRSG